MGPHPEVSTSNKDVARRRSSKNLALRALHREKLRKETGSLMHPKEDPKSDLLCCIRSEGLCRTTGSKHHRRNKQCWSFPSLCLHCKQARATIVQENSSTRRVPVALEAVMKSEIPQDMMTPKLLNQLINESSVQANSNPSITDTSRRTARHVACNLDKAFEQHNQVIISSSDNSSEKNHQIGSPVCESVVYTVEFGDDPPYWDELLPTTPDLSMIKDLTRRYIRSNAPSPECAKQQDVRHDNVAELGSGEERTTRDPRLDLMFVLETKT